MIVRPHPNLLNVLSTLKGSIARRIGAEPLGWMTPLFMAIVSHTFFGLI